MKKEQKLNAWKLHGHALSGGWIAIHEQTGEQSVVFGPQDFESAKTLMNDRPHVWQWHGGIHCPNCRSDNNPT